MTKTPKATGVEPKFVVSGAMNWHLHNTAKGLEKCEGLVGFWSTLGNKIGIEKSRYRRIWPYHLVKLPFYLWAPQDLEEIMRWRLTPLYDLWVRSQPLPADCNVVMGPMGSCKPLFDLADQSSRTVLKVFDAPNSHPNWLLPKWQRECDEFYPGYKIPFPDAMGKRISKEIDQADLVLCPSNFVRDSMVENGVPEEKCFINHFGVNTSIFQPREIVPENPVFVIVGSLCLRKGYQYLFRAFKTIKESHPKARLICIGTSRPEFRKEEPLWQDLGEFYESLSQSEIAKILKEATAFVLPSVEEGFARVLSEAMAAAVPIIATYETGATTVITDEKQGLIVSSRDVDELVNAMERLISDRELNLTLGESGYAAGAIDNTWDDYSKRIYDRVSTQLLKSVNSRE